MEQAAHTHSTSRRALLGAAAALAAVASPGDDAELIAACRTFLDADRPLAAWDAEEIDLHVDLLGHLRAARREALKPVLGRRPRTSAGIRARAEVAHAAMRHHRAHEPGLQGDIAREALVDFLGRA